MLQILVIWVRANEPGPATCTSDQARDMYHNHTAVLLEYGLEYSVAASRQDLDRVLGKLANRNSKSSAADVVNQASELPCMLNAPSLTLIRAHARQLTFRAPVCSHSACLSFV